jgi:16S rRNA (cytosine967-C5)-methyltransferase
MARRLAYDVLRAVDERDAYANLALTALLAERVLPARDAALATELAYGTLRGQGTYDAVLAACADRPLASIDPPVLDLLRLGAHQLLATRIPAHAAVSATVELARAVAGDGRARFVNAVLRRVSKRPDLAAWLNEVAPSRETDPRGHLAVVHSHPRWVVEALQDALGGGTDEPAIEEVAAALAADNVRPQVTLVARPGRVRLEELVALGGHPGRWSPWAAYLPEGDPAALAPVRQGRAGVQDEGSQLAALVLADAPLDGPDRLWLDMCAGPGGKAALLAGLAAQRGAVLLAAERQPHRARLVAGALAEGADKHAVIVADSTRPPWRPDVFDRVLLDAPCTGLGALRRRPEARWRRSPEDVPELVTLQRSLLGRALESVRPGGVVAYVTCSPHLPETRLLVADILRCREGIELLDARPLLPAGLEELTTPDVQLWPHRHGTDAMYIALLRRLR